MKNKKKRNSSTEADYTTTQDTWIHRHSVHLYISSSNYLCVFIRRRNACSSHILWRFTGHSEHRTNTQFFFWFFLDRSLFILYFYLSRGVLIWLPRENSAHSERLHIIFFAFEIFHFFLFHSQIWFCFFVQTHLRWHPAWKNLSTRHTIANRKSKRNQKRN